MRFAGVSWQGVRFERPEGFTDTTVLSFVDNVDAPAISLTVSQQALAGGRAALLSYVKEQQSALTSSVAGYAVVAERERTLAAGPALEVEVQLASAKRVLHQLYVLDEPRARVLVCTVTAQAARKDEARAYLDRLANTLAMGAAP